MSGSGPIAGFGFSTSGGSPDLSTLPDVLARIRATGASHAELSLHAWDLISGGRLILERVAKLEGICGEAGLAYTAHGLMGVNVMLERDAAVHEQVMRATLEIARIVGATTLVHHTGIVPSAPAGELEHMHARERQALRKMADVAGRDGITIAVETLFVDNDTLYTADPFRLADEIEAIGHPHLAGTLDFSHSYLTCTQRGLDFRAAVRRFGALAAHLHVHDSFGLFRDMRGYGRAEDIAFGRGDLHLPIGWGDIPFETLVPELAPRPGTVWMFELPPRYWDLMDAQADLARRLIPLVGTRVGG